MWLFDAEKLYYTALSVLIKPAGISHEEAKALHAETGEGFCDGLFVASIAHRPQGGPSVMFYDFDGRMEDARLNGGALFFVWARIAERLTKRAQLDVIRHRLCEQVWEWCGPALSQMKPVELTGANTYHLRFNLKARPEGFCVHEAQAREVYASDAMIVGALDFQTVPFDLDLVSMDGRTNGDVADPIWWDVWVFLGKHILEHYEAPPGAAYTILLQWVFDIVKDNIMAISREVN